MKPAMWLRAGIAAVALIAVSGCGNGGSWSANPAFVKSHVGGTPPAKARTPLLYISNPYDASVSVYDYRDGTAPKMIDMLTGIAFPEGECVDATGDIFITGETESKIYECAHGGTSPKAVLRDPYGYPAGCAIDPKTGNLAVANGGGFNSSPGNVLIYARATGRPKEYFASNLQNANFCDYDDNGNLYVDGSDEVSGFAFALAELQSGAKSFKPIAVQGGKLYNPSAVQWLGPNLLVGDAGYHFNDTTAIYELKITGLKATIVRAIPLKGSGQVKQFVKYGSKVVAAEGGHHRTIYGFPSGSPVGIISKGISSAFGVAISR